MSIKADVNELESVRSEIKNLNIRRKTLKEREKQVESRIALFLKSKDQIGVKHQGTAVLLEEKETPAPKKNKDRDADAITVLQGYGVQNPEKVLEELMEARKGDRVIVEKLKVQKIKN